jgi:hypothetical protein
MFEAVSDVLETESELPVRSTAGLLTDFLVAFVPEGWKVDTESVSGFMDGKFGGMNSGISS